MDRSGGGVWSEDEVMDRSGFRAQSEDEVTDRSDSRVESEGEVMAKKGPRGSADPSWGSCSVVRLTIFRLGDQFSRLE